MSHAADIRFPSSGFAIDACWVPPANPSGRPGVLVVPGIFGLDSHARDIARQLAGLGYPTLAVDIFTRIGGGPAPDMDAARARIGAIPDATVLGDLAAAAGFLRSLPGVPDGAVGIWGFSLGGRYAVLAAASQPGIGAVATVSALVTDAARSEANPASATERAASVSCPLLALFGAGDPAAGAEKVNGFRAALAAGGRPHQVTVVPGGHTLLNDKTPAYTAEAAATHWQAVAEFFGSHLG